MPAFESVAGDRFPRSSTDTPRRSRLSLVAGAAEVAGHPGQTSPSWNSARCEPAIMGRGLSRRPETGGIRIATHADLRPSRGPAQEDDWQARSPNVPATATPVT